VGLTLPAATPRPIIMRLNDAVSRALMAPDVREKFESQGMEVVASTPEAYGDWIREQMQTWGPIIKALNINLN
jgi:tripartite-type tricarboxylate transporter receptor subunit TctC